MKQEIPNPDDTRRASLWQSLRGSIKWLIDLEEGLDRENTVVRIKNNKRMRGANAWLLMCSIMIASLGLDLNSPAVIIGAMLISPLMSPILGMGLAVGTNDREMLNISTSHFGIAIGIALVTSYIYFTINPMGHEAPTLEILSRTKPTLLDSLVAIFGGIAGIISASRKDQTNAIPGVAIATALMPPLCVSGYGLANADFNIILNSFYLFFLNSFFVALSTFVIVRYLKFPVRKILNSKEQLRTTLALTFFSLILILPSARILYKVLKENKVNQNVGQIVSTYFDDYSDPKCLDYKYTQGDSTSILILELVGQPLSDSIHQLIEGELRTKINPNAVLYTFESNELDKEKLERLEAQVSGYSQLAHQLEIARNARIEDQKALNALKFQVDSIRADTIPFKAIAHECDILFDQVNSVSYGKVRKGGTTSGAMMPTFYVQWNSRASQTIINRDRTKMYPYLISRTGLDTLEIVQTK